MSPELIAYPFLFVAIFFESFVLVTFLSKPARIVRGRTAGTDTPHVAIIVPCYNEGTTIKRTCESLLALEYPKDKLDIILVDDGSTDATPVVMEQFRNNPQIQIIRKENGGKHTALNIGMAATTAPIVGCLDADSFVEANALREIVSCFERPQVAAATAAMSVYEPHSIVQHMQNAEYIFGITSRHALASINGLYVTPGPFSFYRRSVVEELGGFRYGHQTEDMEMALRLQRAGYEIANAPRARVYTKTPETVLKLLKQRTRWTSGFLRNVLGEYRTLIGKSKYGALGLVVLPAALIALVGSISLYCVALFQLSQNAIRTIEIRAGIPLTYAITPHGPFFDWFYFPTSVYLFLGTLTIVSAFSIILVGKSVSKTPGNITLGLVSYFLLYGLIAPLWLIRAVSDVTLSKRRNWR
jgi:cellulose synthase/poly-beta-1,6-N-acetylglucosamine synthase-like glycosyltransferase